MRTLYEDLTYPEHYYSGQKNEIIQVHLVIGENKSVHLMAKAIKEFQPDTNIFDKSPEFEIPLNEWILRNYERVPDDEIIRLRQQSQLEASAQTPPSCRGGLPSRLPGGIYPHDVDNAD